VREYGFDQVAVATGSRWRADGIGRHHTRPIPVDLVDVLTPDDLFAGARPTGERVVLYDDDHYYLGGAIAELLAAEGKQVTLVTPATLVSEWTVNTMEQPRIHRRLVEAGVELLTARDLVSAGAGVAQLVPGEWEQGEPWAEQDDAEIRFGYADGTTFDPIPLDSLVLVTARLPDDALARELGVTAVGDALAPGTIASAVWDGRRYAEELDTPPRGDDLPYKREVVKLA